MQKYIQKIIYVFRLANLYSLTYIRMNRELFVGRHSTHWPVSFTHHDSFVLYLPSLHFFLCNIRRSKRCTLNQCGFIFCSVLFAFYKTFRSCVMSHLANFYKCRRQNFERSQQLCPKKCIRLIP